MIAILAGVSDVAGSNNLHPVGAIAVAIAAIAMLLVPRAHVPTVVLMIAAAMPSTQRIVIAGADFNFLRVVVLFGVVRQLARSEYAGLRWNIVDTFVAMGVLARTICFPISRGSSAELIAAIGANYELAGIYILFRTSIRSLDDVRRVMKVAAWICAMVVPLFLIERSTGRNLFSAFGGIAEFTAVREGRLRCKGAFSHAILAGCFFVSFLPLWIAMFVGGTAAVKRVAALGILSSLLVVFACASSTPVVGLLLGASVWIAWPMRAHLRILWMSAVASGFVLHFLMSKGVWHLIARIDLVGGSTGAHRVRLIEGAIKHFGEWWMIGTHGTAHWGWGLFDVTNQYIAEGVRGGIWAVLAILGVMTFGYASVGRELRRIARERRVAEQAGAWAMAARSRADEAMVFGIGAAICTQMAIFLAVSYFGQTVVIWQLLMATAASLRQWSMDGRGGIVMPRLETFVPRPSASASARADGRRSVPPLPVGGEMS